MRVLSCDFVVEPAGQIPGKTSRVADAARPRPGRSAHSLGKIPPPGVMVIRQASIIERSRRSEVRRPMNFLVLYSCGSVPLENARAAIIARFCLIYFCVTLTSAVKKQKNLFRDHTRAAGAAVPEVAIPRDLTRPLPVLFWPPPPHPEFRGRVRQDGAAVPKSRIYRDLPPRVSICPAREMAPALSAIRNRAGVACQLPVARQPGAITVTSYKPTSR